MKDFLYKFYQNHSLIYRVSLFVLATVIIVYLFPKGGQFRYNFQKGKPWQYENLYAPFDFAIQKSEEELQQEALEIEKRKQLFFRLDPDVVENVKKVYNDQVVSVLEDSTAQGLNKKALRRFGESIINRIYEAGYVNKADNEIIKNRKIINLRKGNTVKIVSVEKLITSDKLMPTIKKYFEKSRYKNVEDALGNLIYEILSPNIFYDKKFTQKVLDEELKSRSFTKGLITKDERIIMKGDIVDNDKYQILMSLKKEYDSQLWSESNYNWIVFGYVILVALALLMLFLFIQKYRPHIFENNTKLNFIVFNMVLFIALISAVTKYWPDYIYVVPIIILPIILKAFFDARLGLFVYLLTVLLLGFVVPNNFEFVFLQVIAGIVTILTVSELHQRANLFISISKITLVYIVAYIAITVTQEGNTTELKWNYLGFFLLNGVFSFLSLFLILIYEKVSGLVSDVSLLELSNTNTKLLRDLNEKAPGTFQHSMQVANLAEASANEIGANAMLVRTGALYHDIGKMLNPMYFTENQTTNVNPHQDLTPEDSARIIIGHVIKGIELAKKNGLPDRIIDFIRTHHGTSLVYYFYKQQNDLTPDNVNMKNFRYPGPIPFSKETAILMMCDACEAASKSLKEPTASMIDDLVERIINGQLQNGQFMNADITLKEIQMIKKVIKKKLHNIYHLRIEYPE